jgi:hypothetical protein
MVPQPTMIVTEADACGVLQLLSVAVRTTLYVPGDGYAYVSGFPSKCAPLPMSHLGSGSLIKLPSGEKVIASPTPGVLFETEKAGVNGVHIPPEQSAGQLLAFSPASQTLLPHTAPPPPQVPQSAGHELQSSPGPHRPFPQKDTHWPGEPEALHVVPGIQQGQSLGQTPQSSPALQIPSPHEEGQSAGQFPGFSPDSQMPFPHDGPQEPQSMLA